MSDDNKSRGGDTLRVAATQTAQAVREEKVRAAFAAMAAMLLRHVAGGDCLDNRVIADYLAVHDAMAAESEDPRGIAVPQPELAAQPGNPDEAINTLLRGALRQVAALLEDPRMGEHKSDAYEAGRDELMRGLFAINAKLGIPPLEAFNQVRSQIGRWAMPGGTERPRKDDLINLLMLIRAPRE
jgi:hypothetical protein